MCFLNGLFVTSSLLICLYAFGEPASFDAFFLLKELVDTPEKGAAEDAENGLKDRILDEQIDDERDRPQHSEYRPDARTKVILAFYDDRVKNSDDDKRRDGDNKPVKAK